MTDIAALLAAIDAPTPDARYVAEGDQLTPLGDVAAQLADAWDDAGDPRAAGLRRLLLPARRQPRHDGSLCLTVLTTHHPTPLRGADGQASWVWCLSRRPAGRPDDPYRLQPGVLSRLSGESARTPDWVAYPTRSAALLALAEALISD